MEKDKSDELDGHFPVPVSGCVCPKDLSTSGLIFDFFDIEPGQTVEEAFKLAYASNLLRTTRTDRAD
jgi:hypothetical protein